MAQFEPMVADIELKGAHLAYIAAEKREGVWKPPRHFEKHPNSFPFLLDEDRSVTKSYGLYHRLGKDAINIARPATLVVDRSGVIRYIYRGDNQHDRAPLAEVMGALGALSGCE
jgi:peroxiredoxin